MTSSGPEHAITIDQCRAYLTTHLFQLRPKTYKEKYPKWPGTVGLEVEMLPVVSPTHADDDPGVVRLQGEQGSLAAALRQLAKEKGWQCIESEREEHDLPILSLVKTEQNDNLSFEPGGQLEFSSLPYPCLSDAVRRVRSIQQILDDTLKQNNWQLQHVGINPWHTVDQVGLQMAKKRYRAMDAHFNSIGPFGQRMMRQTCTIQVCLDFGPDEESMVQRFLVSQLLAPFSAAIFANSAFVDNKQAGMVGYRTFIWRHLDRSRTGFPNLAKIFEEPSKKNCIESYLNFLLNARVVFVERLGYFVPTSEVTFRQWIQKGINNIYPDLNDFITHISLQFPEVRPRGFLELRSVDCQARAWQIVPAAYYTGLLYDQQNLQRTFELLSPFRHQLDRLMLDSARGLEEPRLQKTALQLMKMACEGFERVPPCFRGEGTEKALKIFSDRYTFAGRTPAHEVLDTVREEGRSRPSASTFQKLNDRWFSLLQ